MDLGGKKAAERMRQEQEEDNGGDLGVGNAPTSSPNSG